MIPRRKELSNRLSIGEMEHKDWFHSLNSMIFVFLSWDTENLFSNKLWKAAGLQMM